MTALFSIIADLLLIALVLVGVFFMLLSTYGMLRLPDTYGRLHAVGKAGTLGIICILLAVGLHIGTPGAIVRALVVVVLFYCTQPIAAHLIGRVVWRAGGRCDTD
jgi:multicomponent Na+:H+ antiporter subunit G